MEAVPGSAGRPHPRRMRRGPRSLGRRVEGSVRPVPAAPVAGGRLLPGRCPPHPPSGGIGGSHRRDGREPPRRGDAPAAADGEHPPDHRASGPGRSGMDSLHARVSLRARVRRAWASLGLAVLTAAALSTFAGPPGCGGPRPSPRGRGDRRRGPRPAAQPRAGRRRGLTSAPGAAAPAVGLRRVPRPHGERPPRRTDQPAASLLRGRRLTHSTHRMTGRPRGPGQVVGATAGRHVGGRGHRGATTAATATAPRDPVSRAGRPAAPPSAGAGAECPARSTRSTRASPSRW